MFSNDFGPRFEPTPKICYVSFTVMKTEKLIYVDSNKERNTSAFAITIVHMFSYLLHNSTRCIKRNMKPFAALLLNCGAFGADLCVCLCAVFLGLNVAKE